MVLDNAVDALLERKGMLGRDSICLTTATSEFDLEHYHLSDLDYHEVENPHGANFNPERRYQVQDVARKALQVNGPTGDNLELRNRRAQEETDRAAVKQRMAEERAQAAARLDATSPADKLCKQKKVAPWSTLTKKDTMEKFGLESFELEGLGVTPTTKPNPRNRKWSPMKLYKAGDVANALVRRQQHRAAAREASRNMAQDRLQKVRERRLAAQDAADGSDGAA